MTALPFAPSTATGAAGRLAPALAEAARRTGVPFEALFNTARLESGFDPDARARTSSATGLFQFIDSTWLDTLARHGPQHGLNPGSRAEALALRRDPVAASLMAAAHMADNAAVLTERTGREPGQVDLYLAHFLGAGGAAQFLERMAVAPDSPAAELMPAAARANRSVFYSAGRARSLAEVHDFFARKLGAVPVPDGSGPRPSLPDTAQPAPRLAGLARGIERAFEGAPPAAAPQAAALQSARLAYLLLADLGA
jgi:hypothetical protein